MKKFLFWLLGIILAGVITLGLLYGPMMFAFLKVTEVTLDPHAKVFLGGGGNSLVLTSPDNTQVVVVDTKMGKTAAKLKAYVDSLGANNKVTVIGTHFHGDHTGGNSLFVGATVIAGKYTEEFWKKQTGSKYPDVLVAAGEEKTVDLGSGELVKIFNLGDAHTQNDTVVYIPSRKLLVTGDLLFNHWNPVLKKESDTNVAQWIKALDTLLQKYDIQTVLPGHGPVTNREGMAEMRDYFSSIYTAVGQPERLAELRVKYKNYSSLPGMSGFDKTVQYIENEKTQNAEKKQ
ncbi:MAG: MBL fold metallo-hydrolase [Candidatus Firestonebacteria bacterium]|nr:MBL fold metallo-hydrolase [Candidatus Firestonebacteria bacterium]